MSLTEIVYYIRKYAPVTIFFTVFSILLYLVVTMYITYLKSTRQPDIYINPIFGKLPYIKETVSLESPNTKDSILDTIEGVPITATTTARVYKYIQGTPKLGYIQNITLMARTFGIDTETTKHRTEGNDAIFENYENLLTIDITNYNFSYSYKIASKDALITNAVIPDEQTYKEKMKQFLRTLGRYPQELAQGKEVVTFHMFDPNSDEIIPADDPKNAQIIELDLYRSDVDTFPVYPPRYFNSQNYIAATFSNFGDMHILKAQIMFFDKDENKWGIYPIKTGEQAWQDYINGKGITVAKGIDTYPIKIKKMLFGYYDMDSFSPYLEPIYVFIGESGFVSYIQAVTDNFATDSAFIN